MPIYEYRCEGCYNSFEMLVRSGHNDEARCPACSSSNLSREMSVFASRAAGGVAIGNSDASAMRAGGGCCGGSCGCH